MVGGMATLSQMTEEAYETLRQQTAKIVAEFSKWLKEYNNGEFSHYHLAQKDSLFWFVSKENVRSIQRYRVRLVSNFYHFLKPYFQKEFT